MTFFQHLPSSVLQAGAIFLSIIIEALPFVLIGSIISGIIEVYITPERVYRFLPKNKFGRIFFGTFIGFIFPSCECGIVPIINRFLEKKVPSLYCCPLFGDSTGINPIVLFATYSAFGNSVKMALYRALGSLLVATALGIFLGFIQTDSIQKEHRKAVHEHDFRDLSKVKSSSKSWCKPLMNSLIQDATWYLVASLPASSKSMSQHGSSLRSVRHRLLLFSFSWSCPFSSHFVARRTPLLDPLF